jgi:hypothetical protein
MIHFPKLLYSVNQELELIVDNFPDFDNLPYYPKGTRCVVEEIVGYGYDIRFPNGELFRLMNSELPLYLIKTTRLLPVKQRIGKFIQAIKKRVVSAFHMNPETTLKLDVIWEKKIFAAIGTHFYYKTRSYKDKTYYALYDPITHEKMISMNQLEFNKYCTVPY